MSDTTETASLLHVEEHTELVDAVADGLADAEYILRDVSSLADGLTRLESHGADFDCIVMGQLEDASDVAGFVSTARNRHARLPFVVYTPVADPTNLLTMEAVEYLPLEVVRTDASNLDARIRAAMERSRRNKNRRRYEEMLNHTSDMVYTASSDGKLVEVNEPAANFLGYDRDELVELDASQLTDAEGVETYERVVRELLDDPDRSRATVELRLRTADGEWIESEDHVRILESSDGYEGRIGVVRDVSLRKRRGRERDRYETLLETMPDTVVVTDLEGNHTDIHGFQEWSGYDTDELVGEHFSLTMTPQSVEWAEAVVEELMTNDDLDTATYEAEILTKDGTRIPHEVHISLLPPDEDGRVPGTISVLRNISERKDRERDLERQNSRLEEFTSIVSHDLRNPLNVARGHLDLARSECVSDHHDRVDESLDRMATMIENLLALAKEGDVISEFERESLSSVARSAWNDVQTASSSLVVEDDCVIAADPERLRQALQNLFRNANEHGPTSMTDQPDGGGSAVTVRVGSLQDGFFLEDDGRGIPEDERDRVLTPGYSSNPGGSGFGLSIVSRIAEAHGWDVTVTDGTDGGARFEFTSVNVSHDPDGSTSSEFS